MNSFFPDMKGNIVAKQRSSPYGQYEIIFMNCLNEKDFSIFLSEDQKKRLKKELNKI